MSAVLIADPPQAYAAWQAGQLQVAAAAPGQAQGEAVFQAACAKCHAVRGTAAAGHDGPDLTHLMSRTTLAAGPSPNTLGALEGWVANPQATKPGARMPAALLDGPQLQSVGAIWRR